MNENRNIEIDWSKVIDLKADESLSSESVLDNKN